MLTVESMTKCPNCKAPELILIDFEYAMLNSVVDSFVIRKESYQCESCLGFTNEEWVIKKRIFTPPDPPEDEGERILKVA